MNRKLILRPEAEAELVEAVDWYETRGKGLGAGFMRAVDAAMATIQRNPRQYQIIEGRVRRRAAPVPVQPHLCCVGTRRHRPRVLSRPTRSSTMERADLIGHEFSSIRLGQTSAHSRSLVIRHDVDAGAPRLNFARIFGQLFLVFLRPGFRLPEGVSEHFDHHAIQYTTGPVTGNRAARLPLSRSG